MCPTSLFHERFPELKLKNSLPARIEYGVAKFVCTMAGLRCTLLSWARVGETGTSLSLCPFLCQRCAIPATRTNHFLDGRWMTCS